MELSVREQEVLDCLTDGACNKIIARRLNIAEGTVKAHLKRLYLKLGVTSRTQAVIWRLTQ